MKVIQPNTLTIVSSSLAESDATDGPEWAAGTTYAAGALFRYQHKRYASIVASNVGNNPASTSTGTLYDKWRLLGATNLYACIDDTVSTQTVLDGIDQTLTITVPFSRATSSGLLNVDAAEVHVVVKDDQGDIYFDKTYSMTKDLASFSAYQYCFYPLETAHEIVETEVPMPVIGTLTVTLTGNNLGIGHIVNGRAFTIGQTKYSASVGETDYSRKITDDFGVTTFVKRAYAATMSLPIYLHPDNSDGVIKIMHDIRATPSLFIGDNRDTGFQSLTIYGWKEDFRMVYAGPNEMEFTLDIQGLI